MSDTVEPGQTGYANTFIAASEDSPAGTPQTPPTDGSIAAIEHALLADAPGRWTSDDLLFEVYRLRKGVPDTAKEREHFFEKPHPCLRASPLAKRYGWGFAFDEAGRITLVGVGTPEYAAMLARSDLTQLRAMRSSRATAPAT